MGVLGMTSLVGGIDSNSTKETSARNRLAFLEGSYIQLLHGRAFGSFEGLEFPAPI